MSGHNWLAALPADVRVLHAGIRRNAEQVASDAIEARRLLIEAKQSLPHGHWEEWLRQNCDLSERTARRYMKATVADIWVRDALVNVCKTGLDGMTTRVFYDTSRLAAERPVGVSA
jgi:hypothetical protein